MSGDAPYEGHNPVVVLLLILIGVITTPWLTFRGTRLLIRARRAGATRATVKALATLAWAVLIGMYSWGVLHLFFLDDTDQSRACIRAVGTRQLTAYDTSFVPLQFGCRTSDGHVVEAAVVPSYVNPATAVLAVCAVTLTGFTRAQSKEEQKCSSPATGVGPVSGSGP
ncbi:hypothetical protein AB0I98_12230 [Streptomyces sp. NPDC050211]|uniref:hypothetical protein n=1 Tax=Streptomyces sp. NPDC050211 TaxID=3154932 RepID=UPI00342B5169